MVAEENLLNITKAKEVRKQDEKILVDVCLFGEFFFVVKLDSF